MKTFYCAFAVLAISTSGGCSQLKSTEYSCSAVELPATRIVSIVEAELKKRGMSHYPKYRTDVFRVECDYIYRESYLPETPGRWFDVVISSDGSVTEIVRGK